MKNLSKVFAFMLAFAMVLSMGTFAATGAQFSDIDKATNPDSISMLATLNVMNGYTDGTIRPQGQITRAEIAKMIYVIKMGGKDDGAAYYKGVKTNLTDINGHWAEGYIKYCFSTGIVAGRDDNKFDPDANVTGIELAKMLLVIQGYNANKSGLVGAGWSNKVVELGAENEYFTKYNTLLNAAATREGAATIMVNALDATVVTWSEDANEYVQAVTNLKTETLGKRYFSLTTHEGVLLSTGEYAVDYDGENAQASDGKLSMIVEKTDDEEVRNVDVSAFKCEEDLTDLLGQYVRVSVDGKGNVYGIYAVANENLVVDATVDQVTLVTKTVNGSDVFDNKIEVDGQTYKVDTTTAVYTTGDGIATSTIAAYFKNDETFDASAVRFIDNTGDGKIDIALVNPILAVRQVTATTSTSFTAGEKIDYEDVSYAAKFTKGQYVVKTMNFFEDKANFALATVVEGEVTSTATETRDGRTLPAVEIDDDAWYTRYDATRTTANNGSAVSVQSGASDISISSIGGTQRFVIVGNVIYFNEVITAGAADIAYVAEGGAGQTTSVCKMKLVFSDGTSSTVNARDPEGTPYASSSLCETGLTAMFEGKLVAYEINDDGEYELTVINSTAIAGDYGYGSYAAITNYDEGLSRLVGASGSYIIDKTATVFVEYVDDAGKTKYTVISGEDVLNFANDFGSTGVALMSKSGVKSAAVVVLKATSTMPGAEDGKGLAIITSNATTMTKIGSSNYYKVTVWTLNGQQTLYVSTRNYTANNMALGSSFIYNLDANSTYNIATDISMLKGSSALYYVDGSKSIAVSDTGVVADTSNTYKLATDVKVLNVDTKSTSVTGVEDDSIYEAEVISAAGMGTYLPNAYYFLDQDSEIAYIVVDVNGSWNLRTDR